MTYASKEVRIPINLKRGYQPPEIEDVSEPFCGSRRRFMTPLADANPVIASEWCYKRNAGWGPEDFSHASSVKAWWECPFCLREYKAVIAWRTSKDSACPYCSSRRVCDDNALSVLNPEVAGEWHPKKNGKLKASDVTFASGIPVWWLCKTCKHEWKTRVVDRTTHECGCPGCYDDRMEYARAHPPEKIRPNIVLGDENQEVSRAWYDSGRIAFIPLAISHPKIAKQWHPAANGNWTPKDFAYGSDVTAWWKCNKGKDHEWQSTIASRTGKGRGNCPFCLGKRVSVTHSLKTKFPAIANQWHPTLNGILKPEDVTAGSNKKVWWICKRGPDHRWQAAPTARTAQGAGCPYCAGRAVSNTNSLAALAPQIAADWHKTKNGKLTASQVTSMSHKKVWWQCKKGHAWQQVIGKRVMRQSTCPQCKT